MPESAEYAVVNENEAIAAIEMVIDTCSRMGANDVEIPALRQLEQAVRDGKIDPAEAVRQAESIQAAKQDYH